MKPLSKLLSAAFWRVLALQSSLTVLVVSTASAQVAPSRAPYAATLATFDKNHNGGLDPDELAAMEADQKKPVSVETKAVRAFEWAKCAL